MRIVYLAPADIQIARVDRQCIVQFCSALAQLGVDVELVALYIRLMRGEVHVQDPLTLYGVPQQFRCRLVPVPVGQRSPGAWVALNRLAVHLTAIMRHARSHPKEGPLVFYTKTYSTAAVLLALKPRVRHRPVIAFEIHRPPRNVLQRWVLRSADRVIANTYALQADLVAAGQVARDRVLGIHQGVDAALLAEPKGSRPELRAKLGLPTERKLVVYTGKIFIGYAEVESLLEAAREMAERQDVLFVLVGGREDHVSRLRNRLRAEGRSNVRLVGFVPPRSVRAYQLAADVLILYYPSGLELNSYRSPGKLFEYMASRRPIVAVDLPVLREVLGDPPAAAVVPPDAPPLLAREIAHLIDNPATGQLLAETAHRRVAEFTWGERAARIMEFLR